MTWIEIINNASGSIGLCVAGFSGIIIALYQVRVHQKVIFKEHGELNFVTVDHCKVNSCNECGVHPETIQLLHDVKTIQQGNIHRMDSFEEAMKKSIEWREKHSDMLGAISTQLATLIANTVHMSSDIQELKDRVKA